MLFNFLGLQILFCSCINETTLFSFLWSLLRENGRSLHFPKIFLKKQTRWSNDKTNIELGYWYCECFAQPRPIIANYPAPNLMLMRRYSAEEYQKDNFFSHWRKVTNLKRLCFFENIWHFLIFLYWISPHQLLKYKCHDSLTVFPFNTHF